MPLRIRARMLSIERAPGQIVGTCDGHKWMTRGISLSPQAISNRCGLAVLEHPFTCQWSRLSAPHICDIAGLDYLKIVPVSTRTLQKNGLRRSRRSGQEAQYKV